MTEQHRAEHVESAGDYYARAQNVHQIFAVGVNSPETRGATERDASQYSVQQGQQLLQGQQTRSDAPTPDANYASYSHEDLHKMVNEGLNFESINDRSRVTNTYGNWLADASNQFRDAANTAGAEWQGEAAAQAHSFFQSTADHTEKTGNAMQLVSNRYSQQSAAADYAQRNMPEPTGFDQKAEMAKATEQFQNGNPLQGVIALNDIATKQQQADAAHQQAVQVMHGLDTTYHETSTTQPVYAPPPQLNNDSTQASSASPVTVPGGASSGPYVGPGGPGTGGPGPGFTSPPLGGPAANTFGSPSVGNPAVSPPGMPYAPGPGVNTGTGPLSNTGLTGGGNTLRTTPSPLSRLSPDGLALGGGGGTGNAGEDTPRTRSGGGIGRGGAGGRVTGGTGSGGSGKPGESGGKGAAERLERGATAAANAGKGGKPGAAGAGAGAAGAGKKKEEDKEHKNKIPAQVDPDEVFEVKSERGPDGEKITPPVLGG
ncbi:hypothetical protein ATK30_2793 [Amycolatopsis echigonensis]|uniref:PPE family protein n=1 Tax=Amycolatopsis echigonensis TaxID=2576905 RepID=A0A2N3WDR7_9PSEU|nr:hypothetical protein [Amycolatopsis niigatensis]PKV92005.1 hypothetical protein ATK30_2793 [Amycolatopsis niigatensis]